MHGAAEDPVCGVQQIKALDLGRSEIVDHYDPNIVKFILGSKVSK